MQNQDNSTELINPVRFLSTTLHEIRTPIQTIIGSIELLSETNLDTEQSEYLRQISFSAETLLSLANNILDYSKISNKDFSLEQEPLDIIELVESTADLISIEAFNKGLEIAIEFEQIEDTIILGSKVRIQQVLLNLIKNAVKFTQSGYILIKVTIENNFLLFKVIDSGIGIPDDVGKKLFDPYYQLDNSATRKYGGTGLGLTICKSLITAMKGKTGVTNNPDGGSIFYFTIPYKPIKSALQKNYSLIVPGVTKILIIDASPIVRHSFINKLNNFGITNVYEASSHNEAIELMKDHAKNGVPFTEVFIDFLLPKVDGWHLAAVINKDKEINNSKLYLTIQEGQIKAEARMKMLNWFDGYLYKPVKIDKLHDLLVQSFIENLDSNAYEQNKLFSAENISLTNSALVPEPETDETQKLIAKDLTILVAEDHLVNRKLLTTFLTKFGATVIEAENGQNALDLFMQNPNVDFIFMDIQMPILSGIDATKKIRLSGYKGIIIACTANSDRDDFNHYENAGMNDVIVKPFKSIKVKEIILKWKTAVKISSTPKVAKAEKHSTKISTWEEADFLDTVGNDISFAKQLLTDFEFQTQGLIDLINDKIKSNNFEELRRIGHTLKGSSSTVSAFALASLSESLNKSAKEKDITKVKSNYKTISKEFTKLKNTLKQWYLKNEL